MKKQNIFLVVLFACILTLIIGYITYDSSFDVPTKTAISKEINVVFYKVGKIEEYNCENTSATITKSRKQLVISNTSLLKKGGYTYIPVTIKNEGNIPVKLLSIRQENYINNNLFKVEYTGIKQLEKPILPGETREFFIKVSLIENILNEEAIFRYKIDLNFTQASKGGNYD